MARIFKLNIKRGDFLLFEYLITMDTVKFNSIRHQICYCRARKFISLI